MLSDTRWCMWSSHVAMVLGTSDITEIISITFFSLLQNIITTFRLDEGRQYKCTCNLRVHYMYN